ncbi:DsrE family protein [bacterium]
MKKSLFVLILLFSMPLLAQVESEKPKSEQSEACCQKDRLDILWTSGEKEVFTKVVYPYSLNSRKMGWWKEVSIIVWGPSSKLLSEDSELQDLIGKLKENGVILTACKWCSDQYEVSDKLKTLGIDVKYMGKPLTEYLKSGHKVLVF